MAPILFLYGIPGIYLAWTIPFGEITAHTQGEFEARIAHILLFTDLELRFIAKKDLFEKNVSEGTHGSDKNTSIS